MFFWIIRQVAISLILILLIHYLYFFLKTNLTEPKIKDLVNKPTERYMEMYKTMGNTHKIDKGKMKDELKNYLKTLTTSTTVPAAADSVNSNYQTF